MCPQTYKSPASVVKPITGLTKQDISFFSEMIGHARKYNKCEKFIGQVFHSNLGENNYTSWKNNKKIGSVFI